METIIGKLATDEGFRRRFLQDALTALDEARQQGCELTAVEIQALASTDPQAIRALADGIDGRLQKVDFHSNGEGD